jgi:lipopolysaccharide export LptBFGC system permease protein LptF
MSKPFTIIAALLLFVVAAAHAYRAYAGLDLIVAGHAIPILASWICAVVAAFLGIMLFVERSK